MGLTVKWAGKEYSIADLPLHACVLDLKNAIHEKTGVKPERQKLIGIKCKGKALKDMDRLSDLNLDATSKIMMVGSLEENILSASVPPEDLPEVVNDLDDIDEQEIPVEQREEFLTKIEKRVKTYEIKRLNESRPGKKLLVLDIDYTIFAQSILELKRPFLHEFLTTAYEDYDIAIWSATNMKWIETKLKELGVTKSPDYKIVFMVDCGAMISVHTSKHGLVDVKPLAVIWGKFPEYGPENTIMIDDIRRNFLMNPKNGLRVRPFRSAHTNRDTDRELVKLSQYLKDIASIPDVRELNHRHWESYKPQGP
ncbi:ubiquitin-like domain-containing CTD phosphatase 1 isoform X2 [Ornithodoros turicata]|uniref:ubiquitin-like domain-containing CTD phosphatase 1 isoform X2 n=1 Tax=Ornithodoros turicata TaxID=34597 RepID=UPI0031386EA9